MRDITKPIGWGFFLTWVATHICMWVTTWGVFVLIIYVAELRAINLAGERAVQYSDSWANMIEVFYGLLIGLIPGVIIGITQSMVISMYAIGIQGWARTTIWSSALGAALLVLPRGYQINSLTLSPPIETYSLLIVPILIISFAQWRILRTQVDHALYWIVGNILAFILIGLVNQLVVDPHYGNSDEILYATVISITYTAITGLTMLLLLRRSLHR